MKEGRIKLCVLCRLPSAILEVAKAMVLQKSGNSVAAAAEKEAGWMLIAALMSSMPKQVAQTFYLRLVVIQCYVSGQGLLSLLQVVTFIQVFILVLYN